MNKIKVLVVDDSASVRKVLSEILVTDRSIEVLGAASDPLLAMNKMKIHWPDVIITDIEMPRKDGITFMKEIMETRPTPFIICSSVDEKIIVKALGAMSLGAVDIITKPKVSVSDFLHESAMTLIDAVKSAASADLKKIKLKSVPRLKVEPKLNADVILSPATGKNEMVTDSIVAIGASAGGTQAIELVLKALPKEVPGIVIVQHMPEKFTRAFSERLNGICAVDVKEGSEGDRVERGKVIIAPGNRHMIVNRRNKEYYISIKDGPLVSRHRPAVDVLFRSIAKNAGSNALGIILTGMGDDGAAGMLEMRNAGTKTIAQDKKTSVVYGMPKEAYDRGGVEKVMSLYDIPDEILIFKQ
jgi:two-component system, chemotaxis family, protein-glutamate methylesterase/glutaminase